MVGPWSFAGSAGMLPEEVLAEARRGLGERSIGGLSALELPFAGEDFHDLRDAAEADLRALLDLPPTYRVLFLQGGATAQFSLVPLNLAGGREQAAYLETGLWSRRAIAAARRMTGVHTARSPAVLARAGDAAYWHVTTTETADGTRLANLPEANADVPLVADMTADLLTAPLAADRFGVVYASAQKNIGTAGLTVVIVREDLLGRALPGTPAPFDYTLQAREESRVNTPPVAALFVAGRMLKWLRRNGGLAEMERRAARRSARLYEIIDGSGCYASVAARGERSPIAVCFRLPDAAAEKRFLDGAARRGLNHLRGHPSVGGIRVSLYNGVPDAAVDALAEYMAGFAEGARRRGGGGWQRPALPSATNGDAREH